VSASRCAILNGALEFLQPGLAHMALVPLQMTMASGVGMTSQVIGNFARDLLGRLAKKYLVKIAGKIVSGGYVVAMSFATTFVLGQVAKRYYSGGARHVPVHT